MLHSVKCSTLLHLSFCCDWLCVMILVDQNSRRDFEKTRGIFKCDLYCWIILLYLRLLQSVAPRKYITVVITAILPHTNPWKPFPNNLVVNLKCDAVWTLLYCQLCGRKLLPQLQLMSAFRGTIDEHNHVIYIKSRLILLISFSSISAMICISWSISSNI